MRLTSIIAAITMSLVAGGASADTIRANVTGMTCESCAQAIHTVLAEDSAVRSIAVNVAEGTVSITEKPARHISDATIAAHIKAAGYRVTSLTRSAQ